MTDNELYNTCLAALKAAKKIRQEVDKLGRGYAFLTTEKKENLEDQWADLIIQEMEKAHGK